MCCDSKPRCRVASPLQYMLSVPRQGVQIKSFGAMLLGETMNKKQKGFSLIELLIVVAIILIIAAIAIPNLLRARSRPTKRRQSVRFAPSLPRKSAIRTASRLGPTRPRSAPAGRLRRTGAAAAATACLIDTTPRGWLEPKSGYTFAAVANGGAGTVATPNTCVGSASPVPITVGTTGQRSFCADYERRAARSTWPAQRSERPLELTRVLGASRFSSSFCVVCKEGGTRFPPVLFL